MSIVKFGKDAFKTTLGIPQQVANLLVGQGSRRAANMQNPPVNGSKIDYGALNADTEAAAPQVQQQPGMGRKVLTSFLDYAKSPEGKQSLIDLVSLAVASGQSDPYVSGAIATGVQERIKQRPILEQQRLEREQAAAAEKRAQEAFDLSQKLGLQDLGAKTEKNNLNSQLQKGIITKQQHDLALQQLNIKQEKLENTLKQGLIKDTLKEQKLKVEKLELEIQEELNIPSEEELMKKEAYKKAYSGWLTKVNSPKEARFRTRMQDSHKILSDLEKSTTLGYLTKSFSPNKMRQRVQAEMNFLTAVLRDESGAAIGSEEYDTARKVYMPQIGDSSKVLKAKQKARERAFELIEPKKIESESIQENATYIGEI